MEIGTSNQSDPEIPIEKRGIIIRWVSSYSEVSTGWRIPGDEIPICWLLIIFLGYKKWAKGLNTRDVEGVIIIQQTLLLKWFHLFSIYLSIATIFDEFRQMPKGTSQLSHRPYISILQIILNPIYSIFSRTFTNFPHM